MADNVKSDLVGVGLGGTEAGTVATVALQAARPAQLTDQLFAFTKSDGSVEVVDIRDHNAEWELDKQRAEGVAVVRDVTSFAGYFDKWHNALSEIFADADTLKVVGVIDAGDSNGAGWQAQRVSLALQPSVAWQAWSAVDGELLRQDAFAEHVENRLVDITAPPAADVLELVQDFHVSSTGTFQSRRPVAGGSTVFTYADNQTARGSGQLEIPKDLTLYLAPFVGAAAVEVIARFRYRLADGHLRLGVKLTRPEDVIRSAFLDVCEQVAAATGTPVWQGRPLT